MNSNNISNKLPNKTSESNPLRFTHGCFFIKKITYFPKKLFIFIRLRYIYGQKNTALR